MLREREVEESSSIKRAFIFTMITEARRRSRSAIRRHEIRDRNSFDVTFIMRASDFYWDRDWLVNPCRLLITRSFQEEKYVFSARFSWFSKNKFICYFQIHYNIFLIDFWIFNILPFLHDNNIN